MKHPFLVMALLLVSPCQAQGLYKVVDADGKIMYTDRPAPASAGQAVSALRTGAPGKSDAAGAVRRQLVSAVEQLSLIQTKVYTARNFCSEAAATFPRGSGAGVAAAADQASRTWAFRHSALLFQKIAVFQHLYTLAENQQHNKEEARQIALYVRGLERMPVGTRLAWCRSMPQLLLGPEFDLAGNAELVDVIMGFVPEATPVPRHP